MYLSGFLRSDGTYKINSYGERICKDKRVPTIILPASIILVTGCKVPRKFSIYMLIIILNNSYK